MVQPPGHFSDPLLASYQSVISLLSWEGKLEGDTKLGTQLTPDAVTGLLSRGAIVTPDPLATFSLSQPQYGYYSQLRGCIARSL